MYIKLFFYHLSFKNIDIPELSLFLFKFFMFGLKAEFLPSLSYLFGFTPLRMLITFRGLCQPVFILPFKTKSFTLAQLPTGHNPLRYASLGPLTPLLSYLIVSKFVFSLSECITLVLFMLMKSSMISYRCRCMSVG